MLDGHRRLRGEGLVDLEDVDVRGLQPGLLQSRRDREGRADAHEPRVNPDACEAPHPRQDGQTQRLRCAAPGHEDHRRPIRHLARVPRRRRPPFPEDRLQLRQALHRGALARAIVGRHGHRLHAAVLLLHHGREGHDLRVEPTVLLRRHGLRVRLHGHPVLHLPGDPVLRRHVLRRHAHGDEARGRQLVLLHIRARLRHHGLGRHRVHGHGLDAACDAHVDHARLDARRDVRRGLQAASALPVHPSHRDVVGQVGEEHGHPRSGAACRRLQHVADLGVPDLLRVDLRPLDDRLEERHQHVLARRVLQRPLLRAGHARAHGAADHHVVVRGLRPAQGGGGLR
mmetsp:Transcript_114492/g.318443  ORF Transcript_114492/g.318443 Transcript_114492/m.318443 type:complete len:341 (+) Transcript_114492:470-1492(+)